jgi:uncharacterized protein YeaC (DUF1315 family)
VPLVRHNDQYINCYIDMGEAPDGIIDPVQQADNCVQVIALLLLPGYHHSLTSFIVIL